MLRNPAPDLRGRDQQQRIDTGKGRGERFHLVIIEWPHLGPQIGGLLRAAGKGDNGGIRCGFR